MIDRLPEGLSAYRRTPIFDQDTVPDALRHNHKTKPGVWGVIHVLEGRLSCKTFAPAREIVLAPDAPGVVAPCEAHKVQPLGNVRFFIEFHRPDGDPA